MITTSKNNSYICVEDVCDAQAEQQVHPLKEFLRELWASIRRFLGTDRWDGAVTLQRGDSHYTMKMEDIEAHWRNR